MILEVKHLLFNFVIQTTYMLKHKGICGPPGGLVHAGLHALGTSVALVVVGTTAAVLVAEFVLHYHFDWMKEHVGRRAGNAGNACF